MKQRVLHYALLLIIFSTTLSSCFLFSKQKHVTTTDKDSTAYQEIESLLLRKQVEAWMNYLKSVDSNVTGITFDNPVIASNIPSDYFPVDTLFNTFPSKPIAVGNNNWVKINPDGTIEAKGNIKEVKSKQHKETVKKDSGSKAFINLYWHINKNTTITKERTINKEVTITKRPNWKFIIIVNLIVLSVILLAYKHRKKAFSLIAGPWGKVVSWLKGWLTGWFH